jgi:hypothetical protein
MVTFLFYFWLFDGFEKKKLKHRAAIYIPCSNRGPERFDTFVFDQTTKNIITSSRKQLSLQFAKKGDLKCKFDQNFKPIGFGSETKILCYIG